MIDMENAFKYYEKTKNSNIPKNIRMFIDMKIEPGICIDLGCGTGRDTVFLIKNGWKVIAIDKENTEEIIRASLNKKEQDLLKFVKQDFEDNITLQSCNLLVANASLSFCHKKYFNELWKKVVNSITKDGYFVGNFFGVNDTWSKRDNMVFFTNDEVLNLFNSFEIINFKEVEKDGKTALGIEKHWHIFNVIAKKNKYFNE